MSVSVSVSGSLIISATPAQSALSAMSLLSALSWHSRNSGHSWPSWPSGHSWPSWPNGAGLALLTVLAYCSSSISNFYKFSCLQFSNVLSHLPSFVSLFCLQMEKKHFPLCHKKLNFVFRMRRFKEEIFGKRKRRILLGSLFTWKCRRRNIYPPHLKYNCI